MSAVTLLVKNLPKPWEWLPVCCFETPKRNTLLRFIPRPELLLPILFNVPAVNLPGYSYALASPSNDPVANPCPADTYQFGLRKQRACVPCPPGMGTFNKTMQSSIAACGKLGIGYMQRGVGGVDWRLCDYDKRVGCNMALSA